MTTAIETLGRLGVIPVITINDAADAVPLAQALSAGGLPCAEVAFRTKAAAEAIRVMAEKVPEMLLGAGTVLTEAQAEAAVAAGAQYIVSPGFDEAVVVWCLEHNVPTIPGVATPTEINMALKKGLNVLKFFPAEPLGGIAMLQALAPAYPEVKFIPTGGINEANLETYLKLPMVHAVGGSWMVSRELVNRHAFAEITRLTRAACSIVQRLCCCAGRQSQGN